MSTPPVAPVPPAAVAAPVPPGSPAPPHAAGPAGSPSPAARLSFVLRKSRVYTLLPASAKVVVFDVAVPLNIVFFAFVEHDITCAPLWDSDAVDLGGVVSVHDFGSFFCHFHTTGTVNAAQALVQHTFMTWNGLRFRPALHPPVRPSAPGRGSTPGAAAVPVNTSIGPPGAAGGVGTPGGAFASPGGGSAAVAAAAAEAGGGGGMAASGAPGPSPGGPTPTSSPPSTGAGMNGHGKSPAPPGVAADASAATGGGATAPAGASVAPPALGGAAPGTVGAAGAGAGVSGVPLPGLSPAVPPGATRVSCLGPEDSLYTACALLAGASCGDVPVVDLEQRVVLSMLGFLPILRYTMSELTPAESLALFSRTVRESGLGKFEAVVTAHVSKPLIHVLGLMSHHRLASIPLVDDGGILRDVYPEGDITLLARDRSLASLDAPVTVIRQRRFELFGGGPSAPVCQADEPVGVLLTRFLTQQVPHVYCVDEGGRLQGFVSLPDVIRYFLHIADSPDAGPPLSASPPPTAPATAPSTPG